MFLTCHTLDLRSSSKHVALQNVSIYYTWKSIRKQYKNSKLKKGAPHPLMNLNCQMVLILFQISRLY